MDSLDIKEYYNAEIFVQPYLNMSGKWKLVVISGCFPGSGIDFNFDYMEVRKYGVYGFIQNGNLLEYEKIILTPQTNENRLNIFFEKDKNSNSFMVDNEKYIDFIENDTLNLNSPCCDRLNYNLVKEN